VEMGALRPEDVEFLNRLVDEAVRAHGDDASDALETLGGAGRIQETFHGTIHLNPDGTVGVTRPGAGPPETVLLSGVTDETPGRYTRLSVYGKGGMGQVLLVHDEFMNRDVAMKELLPSHQLFREEPGFSPMAQTAELAARFLREARITGLLEHPGVVPVYELGRKPDGSLYYTMKLVRGRTFLQALREGKTVEDRLALLPHFMELCQAIAFAHSRGVIHRDLKPANVMVGEFGETVVLDWGIAKVLGQADVHQEELAEAVTALKSDVDKEALETEQGEALGTPHYMPPEQAEGRVDQIDKRSDVYSLGAVLYEMLTAKTPYTGRTTKEILDQVVKQPVRPLLEVEPDIPAELATICEKCLQKDPGQRYQSARELAEEIRRFQSGALVRAYKYTPGQLLAFYYQRHRAVVHTAAAGAAALLLLAVYSYVNITRAYHREQEQRAIAEVARDAEQEQREAAEQARDAEQEAREEAEWEQYVAQIRLAQHHLNSGQYRRAEDLLWETPEHLREWEWGYLLNECHQDLATWTHHESPIYDLHFSPDGNQMLSVAQGADAALWDLETGQVAQNFSIPDPGAAFAAAPSGGDLLAIALRDGTVRLMSAASGEELAKLVCPGRAVAAAAFSPGGGQLATLCEGGDLLIWDTATHSLVDQWRLPERDFWRVEFSPEGGALLAVSRAEAAFVILPGEAGPPRRLAGSLAQISPGGDRVYTASGTFIEVWDARTGERLARTDAGATVKSLALSFAGDMLASGSDSGPAQLWLSSDLSLLHELLPDAPSTVYGFNAGDALLLGKSGDQFHVWDTHSGARIHAFRGHEDNLSIRPALHPGGTMAATGGADGSVKLWSLEGPLTSRTTAYQTLPVTDFALPAEGEVLVTYSADGWMYTLDALTGAPLGAFGTWAGWKPVPPAALSADGRTAVTALDGFLPMLLDLEAASLQTTLPNGAGSLRTLALRPDASEAALATHEGALLLWDTASGDAQDLPVGEDVHSLAYRPDGTMLAVGTKSGRVLLWDRQAPGAAPRVLEQDGLVSALAWSADGVYLAAGSWEGGGVRIWAVDTQEEAIALKTGGMVRSVAFHPTAARLAVVHTRPPSIHLFGMWDITSRSFLIDGNAASGGVYFNADGAVMHLHEENTVQARIAAPYRLDALPQGEPEATWRARFAAYKESRAPHRPAEEAPIPTTFFASRDLLESGVRELMEQVPGDAALDTGFRVDTAALGAASKLGLRVGDVLDAVNGAPVRSPEAFRNGLEARLADLESLELDVRRGARHYHIRYVLLPRVQQDMRLEISLDEAASLLETARAYQRRQADTPMRLRQETMKGRGIPVSTPDAMDGYIFSGPGFDADRAARQQAGLALFSVLVQVNDVPIQHAPDIEALLEAGMVAVGDGQHGRVTLMVEEGNFLVKRIAIEISP